MKHDEQFTSIQDFFDSVENAEENKRYFEHYWGWDWPWEMVDIKDWFYMTNSGCIGSMIFLHVRVLGMHSLWKFDISKINNNSKPGMEITHEYNKEQNKFRQ